MHRPRPRHRTRHARLAGLAALALASASLVAFAPADARACGGTFCDGPTPQQPQPMPVDQTGENILFVVDGTTVEAHIQIQYTGDPRRFAWIVPVQKKPEVTVGSELLFRAMLGGSVPTFQRNGMAFDRCGGSSRSSTSGGCGMSSSDEAEQASGDAVPSSASAGGGPKADDGAPSVTSTSVGAFEVDILEGGTVDGVVKWLSDNAFQTNDAAAPILASYLQKGSVFVAVKLKAGEGSNEIHPLVVKYEGNEPCVPIRLTAIAAKDDMAIRTFFLGDGRWVPTNYKHMVLNDVRFDWSQQTTFTGAAGGPSTVGPGANYNLVVSKAADSPLANGHAFATEYAGPSNVIQRASIASPAWSSVPFQNIQAISVVNQLTTQGLISCTFSKCTSPHPLVMPLLQKWLPAPANVPEAQFYSSLASYKNQIPSTWSAPGFAADFEQRVIAPATHAVGLLDKWPYLTRMLTAISPAEMTEDPTFHARTDLPAVAATRAATPRTTCDGRVGVTLPDGNQVFTPSTTAWPTVNESMPWARRIEEIPPSGAVIVLQDNDALIRQQVKDWNEAAAWPPPPQFTVQNTSEACAAGAMSVRIRPAALGFGGFALALLARRTLRRRRRSPELASAARRGSRLPLW